MTLPFFFALESHTEREAYAMLMRCRQVVVVQSSRIFYLQEFEDIMNADGQLPVGFVTVEHIAAHGQGLAILL
jgi:hypothetical protein